MLLNWFALRLSKGHLERSGVECECETSPMVGIGTPLAEVVAVAAETADKKLTDHFDPSVKIKPFQRAGEGRRFWSI